MITFSQSQRRAKFNSSCLVYSAAIHVEYNAFNDALFLKKKIKNAFLPKFKSVVRRLQKKYKYIFYQPSLCVLTKKNN